MNCAWQAYLKILPPKWRSQVDKLAKDTLQDLRLRNQQRPMLITTGGVFFLDDRVETNDLQYCVNAASEYSPWSARTTADGFLTIKGGHRVGVCGKVVVSNGCVTGFRDVTSLAIRVSRDFSGIAKGLESLKGSVLILGSPGTGKTTLLRDLIRRKSHCVNGSICVVDEREEIFPIIQDTLIYPAGENTDVLSGCPKEKGVINVLRNMGPSVIAVDEITHPEDCKSLIEAAWCGVDLIATAHAANMEEFLTRPVYKPLADGALFQTFIILRQDKTWYLERIGA